MPTSLPTLCPARWFTAKAGKRAPLRLTGQDGREAITAVIFCEAAQRGNYRQVRRQHSANRDLEFRSRIE